MSCIEYYTKLASLHPRLPLADELALMASISSAPSARVRSELVEKLVRHNLCSLIRLVQKRYDSQSKRQRVSVDDAMDVVVQVTFVHAHRVRDIGVCFMAFIRKRITGELADFDRKSAMIPVSRYGFQRARGMHSERGQHGEYDMDSFHKLTSAYSLDAEVEFCADGRCPPTEGDIAHSLYDSIEDQDAEDPATAAGSRLDVHEALQALSPRDAEVMRRRYGLDDGRPKALHEVAAAFRITPQAVHQIEERALSKMRDAIG